jgi:hypothetical protein
MSNKSPAADDNSEQQPIPLEWRSTLCQIADAFAQGNYGLKPGIANVEPISASTAAQIEGYVERYPATLTSLPEATWDSSVCIWDGNHWDVLVDLWTLEEGPSDLVLHAHVHPVDAELFFSVKAVYVPWSGGHLTMRSSRTRFATQTAWQVQLATLFAPLHESA